MYRKYKAQTLIISKQETKSCSIKWQKHFKAYTRVLNVLISRGMEVAKLRMRVGFKQYLRLQPYFLKKQKKVKQQIANFWESSKNYFILHFMAKQWERYKTEYIPNLSILLILKQCINYKINQQLRDVKFSVILIVLFLKFKLFSLKNHN